MMLLKPLLVTAFALLLSAGASARPPSEAENKALADRVAAFDAAMRAQDYEAVTRTIPPKIMEHVAMQGGIEVEALRQNLVAQMSATLAKVQVVSFGMDLGKAVHRELPGGEPYVLIPTEIVMDAGETGRFKARSDTLALLDAGAWYLLRVNETQQVTVLRQVYPEFAGIEFSSGSMEPLK